MDLAKASPRAPNNVSSLNIRDRHGDNDFLGGGLGRNCADGMSSGLTAW
jgi:hypothetical protein